MTRRTKNKKRTMFGIIIISLSLVLFLFVQYKNYSLRKVESEKVEEFLNKEVTIEEESPLEDKKETSSSTPSDLYNYISVLEIPKINLKRGLVDYHNKYNNVKYNIQIINENGIPIGDNTNLVLAAHNGSSSVSFFNKLYKLQIGDTINLYYDGIKYIYAYNNYYEVDKDGKVEIIRDKTKNTITLITCDHNSDDKQLVFIGYLMDKENY